MIKSFMDGKPFAVRGLESLLRADGDCLGYGTRGSGWLVAVLRFQGSRWYMLTGPNPSRDAAWTAIAYPSGRALPGLTLDTLHREQRRKLSILALDFLSGRLPQIDPDTLSIDRQTACAACDRPLSSNAMVRTVPNGDTPRSGQNGIDLRGQTVSVGPECWERLTGQRAARNAARATARAASLRSNPRWEILLSKQTSPARARCPGTCSLDTLCPDCD